MATIFATTLSISAQNNMQVWEGNTYSEFLTSNVDSVTFLLFPDGILNKCEEVHDTIIQTYTIHDTITQTLRDTITNIIKDTVYIYNCDGGSLAIVQTTAVTHSTYNTIVLGGKVSFDSSDAITERGICYATHSTPITEDNIVKASRGTGTFTITITGLAETTSYYLRAYAINEAGIAYGNEIVFTTPAQQTMNDTLYEGACSGKFSVAKDRQVAFSKGNLQYRASTDTWRFAENQTDYIGESNCNISPTYDGWIDLFGWGTSGYDNTANDPAAINYQPWANNNQDMSNIKTDSTQNCEMLSITGECEWIYSYMYSSNTFGYGPSANMVYRNLTGTSANYDWGVYNAISNGGNKAGMWRTLTISEWDYLLNTRTNAKYLRSPGTVNGVLGLIILPDNFSKPASISWTPNVYTSNTYTIDQWATLQAIGAVFLPAAGYRRGQLMYWVQSEGLYWSASSDTSVYACFAECLYFDDRGASTYRDYGCYSRSCGEAVRLVQDL